jgi:hypothetical protein
MIIPIPNPSGKTGEIVMNDCYVMFPIFKHQARCLLMYIHEETCCVGRIVCLDGQLAEQIDDIYCKSEGVDD